MLECADGHSILEVSRRLRVCADTVRTWRRRFLERGLDGLSDEPRPGVPRKITPTNSSWLNLVERWFAELTQKKLRRGDHRSVQALERDIRAWLADWNEHPRPFIWTKTADEILDKAAAYCRRISDSGH
nr:helix-turn-helix domain-containing protein [Streptomyces sp. 3214.6]